MSAMMNGPFPNFKADISSLFLLLVSFLKEEDTNCNAEGEYNSANKVGEEEWKFVEDRAAGEQGRVAIAWLS